MNIHGLDYKHFERQLVLLARDAVLMTPEEMIYELTRLMLAVGETSQKLETEQ